MSARRLAEYRHAIWVTAEPLDISPNPFERELLVHEPIVPIKMAFGIYR
jgi:hypothetical protein